MIEAVSIYLRKKKLIVPGSKVLVACSGGIDSMTLLDIMDRLGYSAGLAHCNFELRGEESDREQLFTEAYAGKKGYPYYTINFNTRQFAYNNKLSIQEAARFLRYTWLEEVRNMNGYACIATAHQSNDQAETILQHIIRGSGLHGLQGIPAKNGNVVRPLLLFSREEIVKYANQYQLPWKEDSSNAEIKYDRNYIRHVVIPALEKLNPAVTGSLFTLGQRMQEAAVLQDEYVGKLLRSRVRKSGNAEILSIEYLKRQEAVSTILYHWLKEAGFTSEQLRDVVKSLEGDKSGLEFLSATHRLQRDRKNLYLMVKDANLSNRIIIPSIPKVIRFNNIEIQCSLVPIAEWNSKKSPRFAYFDVDKVQWPILLRNWEEGDYFYPYGMGKRQNPEKSGKKKLSKYFKDEKLSVLEKENAVVMLSGEKVMWLVGHRSDDRFKVTDKTKTVLKMAITDGYEKE